VFSDGQQEATMMYPAERHRWLIDTAADEGRVSVSRASEELGVVPETIRRDLEFLAGQGLLRRVHGGAIPASFDALGDQPLDTRDSSAVSQKEAIARAALSHLPSDRGSIALDAGSTTGRLASLIPAGSRFQVFTHSIPIASLVSQRTACDVHLIGGRVRGITQATVGNTGEFAGLRVDVAFMGTNGLSTGHGLSTPDVDEAATKSAMVGCARTVVVLVDSRKIGAESTARFAELHDVDLVITDSGISQHQRRSLEQSGVEIVIA
jgi:DeoR family fructose operon transcriptional repressor